jgi:alpha-beta hydrolase superfamily lysophospholipase
MTEPTPSQPHSLIVSDGYPIALLEWRAVEPVRGQVIVLHGVQSHFGWYHGLGRRLAAAGFSAIFPDRRGSGSNSQDRGHAPSANRLVADVAEVVRTYRERSPQTPTALTGISWGGKLAVIAAARHPELVDALALICPGLQPRVGVSTKEKLQIAWAYLTNRRKTFPIPLNDPALFTDSPEGQAFIAADPLSLREGTAGLLAASFFIDGQVRRVPPQVRQPALLMLAGQDRIVDNDKTLTYFRRLATSAPEIIEYPDGHHTLEFDPDPARYALDLAAWLDNVLVDRRDNPLGRNQGQALASSHKSS